MHILIDIRSLQTPSSRERGIGYSLRGWLTEFLKIPYEHTVTLLIDPRLDPPQIDVPPAGEFWQTTPFTSSPKPFDFPTPQAEQIARRETEQFLIEQKVDLVHIPSPFEVNVTIGYPPTVCHCVTTFYDALPVLFPNEYLGEGGERYAIAYHTKLRALSRCSRIVAISQSAADDLVQFTGVQADQIDVIHRAPSPEMFVRPTDQEAQHSPLLQQIGQPYIFAQLGANPIKNVERLVAAFCQLAPKIKSRYKLVVTYRMSDSHRATVKMWLDKYRAGDRVIFTDWVPRHDLRLLFANADLYIHPALREGFGMPIVEAMALGTPVVVSNTGPMPEVAGDGALTFDPYDVDAIADTMTRVLSDANLRTTLGQRAAERARQFTWEKAALAARQTYEKALSAPHPTIKPRRENIWTKAEQTAISKLGKKADIADRDYTVQSNAPIVGAHIAWIRRNMTSHLREAYFDPTIERQIIFNQKSAETVRAAWQLLKDRQEMENLLAARQQNPPQGTALSRDILDRAWQAAQKNRALNAHLLAGPLPEYGDSLGREFYQKLHAASLLSMPPVSEAQKQLNAALITDIHKLAQQIEDKQLQVAQFYVNLLDADVVLREYDVHSDHPHFGPLIVWVRRNLTSHLREAYVDPILERQVAFNQLVVECLSNINGINVLALARLQTRADIMLRGHIARSKIPIIGPFIAWARRNLTAHLRVPYIDPIFERQVTFNHALADLLGSIHQQISDWRLRECYAAPVNSIAGIKEEIARLERQLVRNRAATEIVAEQSEFNTRVSELIERMNTRIEALS